MIDNSRCQNCGGELKYTPDTGVLTCERCGGTFPIIEQGEKPVKRAYSPTFVAQSVEGNQYECATCGAKILVGSNGEVKRCASCGNTTVKKIETKTSTPDGIIPFTLSKRSAVEIFRKWVASRKFAPNDLKLMAKLEKISGLYVPVWNFNFSTTWRYSALGIKKHVDSDGHEDYTEHPVEKVKDMVYSNVLRSASSKISDEFMVDIGDYDFSKLKPYSMEYLLGFSGLDTDVSVHSTYNQITADITSDNERIAKNRLEDDFYRYEGLVCRTRFKDVVFNYSYVPVWANHYTYKGKLYHCYINGQNGRATGKSPKSFFKIGGLVLGILGGIALAVGLIVLLV